MMLEVFFALNVIFVSPFMGVVVRAYPISLDCVEDHLIMHDFPLIAFVEVMWHLSSIHSIPQSLLSELIDFAS